MFESIYKNGKKQLYNLVIFEIEQQKFYQHKRPISIKDIDINKTAVSNKVYFG